MKHYVMWLRTFDLKILWFLIVGGFNTLLGFGLFPCIYWLLEGYRSHYLFMLIGCHIVTVSSAYFTNKFLVFRTQGDYASEMMKFGFFHVIYFLVMILLVRILVEFGAVNPVVVQFCVSVLVVCFSFFWYDKVVFFVKKKEDSIKVEG